ncbi:MAG: polysaccharide deacetylase family protein [Clostridiales bacterium]
MKRITTIYIISFIIIIIMIVFAVKFIPNYVYSKNIKTKIKNSPNKTMQNITIPKNTKKPISEPNSELIEYNGVIRHIFFHCLIAFPENNGSKSLEADCVTVSEFKNCLTELYKNDYILVNINNTFEIVNQNGVKIARQKKVKIPKGKKPLVLSVDDVVYDSKKKGLGMVDKLILDENGEIATSTIKSDGTKEISKNNEIFPILNNFVETHPDFSNDCAKGTLALTGWEGILGYRISSNYPKSVTNNELKHLKPIIQKLKDTGWTFACHSYGHSHPSKISDSYFSTTEIGQWKKEIESVVGHTNIYVYPYGETILQNSPKYKLLIDNGFMVMCGVSQIQEWQNFGNTLYMSRYSIDGTTLSTQRNNLMDLFDSNKVYDVKVRNTLR